MKGILYLIFTLFIALSCSSKSILLKHEIQPEIPLAKLNMKRIAAINPKYKRSYYKILPYLFFNENGTFNEIQGDFYNLKFNISSNINVMTGFWSDYGTYQNSLIVLVARSGTSNLDLKDIKVSVESSKHGLFEQGKLFGNNQINKSQQRILFVKELKLENLYDILNKINDDVITVKVGSQIYRFLNPEIVLD